MAEAAGLDGTPLDSSPTDVGVPEMPHCSDPVLNGQRSSSGISVLDRLIKTCPVWLQLCMAPKQAAETLSREDSGIFLVTRDVGAKCMVLWVHFSERKEQTDDILRYNIREEKTMMYLDGSMLVFDDIFKLVAFYCVSRDILPSPLRLPHVIANTRSLKDLEVISNLGTGFWDSSIKHQRSASASHSGKFSSLANVRSKDVSHGQRTAKEPSDCACEIEISVRSDRLWFVNPIFIEECSNIQTSDKLPLTNCAKPELQLPKTVYRRPPPPPPPPSLHKPPLPSLPPSAPPPNYKPPHSHSTPSGSSTSSSVVSSSPSISEASSHCPAPGSPPTESLIQSPPAIPPSSQSLSLCSPPRSPKSEHLTLHSPEKPFTTDPPYLLSSTDPSPNCSQSGPPSLHSLSDPFSLHSPPNCSPTDPSSLCSPTDPSSLRSPTDPSSLRSPTDPSSLRSPTNPSSLRSPTNPSSLRSPTNPSSLRSPTDPSSLRSPPNSSQSDPHSLHSPTTSPSTEPLAVRSSASSSPTESSPSSPRPSSPPPSCSIPPLSQTDVPLLPSASQALKKAENFAETSTVISVDVDLVGQPLKNMKINNVEEKKDHVGNDLHPQGSQNLTPTRLPPAVPKRRLSGKHSETKTNISAMKMDLQGKPGQASPDLKTRMKLEPKLPKQTETCVSVKTTLENKVISPGQQSATEEHGKKTPPMPPPRKKRSSRFSSLHSGQEKQEPKNVSETEHPSKFPGNFNNSSGTKTEDTKDRRHKKLASQKQKGSDSSFNSPTSDPTAHLSHAEPDSYSTSSADDDTERPVRSSIKKSHSFMLDRAKNRLSIVAITNVFSAFMSADRKLQKKITELAHDKDSYFGNLVQDYKAYSLEMMAKQRSSTEMLQEIRLMMTQLKSYLVQSTELKSMVDYAFYTDDKIDAIVEAALCKCVLKPLKSPIECYLREIHNKDGCLRLLTENQLVIQDTTTTDLGVTTSVPDSGVMEKIMHKFVTMHKTYSPEKKITYLLKSCKLIYDSMATGNPGKPHGADDFLPVLMYVLARCDLVALLLDVEYMMELMDPALQLGEGSYYLTTTYGALEHIKNYDKITVTRQLSLEVQDSIHRWERRRTLNKARVSRSSIQDFITISFEELDSKTRTLATKSDTSVTQVLQQCAEQFEASEPENYGLFVLVNERCLRLTEDSFPQKVKSSLLKNEQKLDFHFLYKTTSEQDTVMKELDFL